MADRTSPPIIAAPPRPQTEFNKDYFNQQYRWLESLVRYLTGVNYLRGNGLFLPGLPMTGYGLIPGEVFSNGGVLTIVQEGDIWAGSLSVTAEVGTVTVTP